MPNDRTRPMTGAQARQTIRQGIWTRPTAELAPGFVQANLVILPSALADAFAGFCQRNPAPLPLLERLPDGSPTPVLTAAGADVRIDVPRYRIYEHGRLMREIHSLQEEWKDDSCAFLLGCSFTFDALLSAEGIPVRHIEQKRNVPMYRTRIPLLASPPFSGHLVVSMRPIPEAKVDHVISLTQAWKLAHGAPVHVGDPATIGVHHLDQPEYGEAVDVRPGEVPVFWACGVSSQDAARESHVSSMITHAPGYMFVTDWHLSDLRKGSCASPTGSPNRLR